MTRQETRDHEQRDQDAALSRRTLVRGLALGAAATMAGPALAQTGPAAPPSADELRTSMRYMPRPVPRLRPVVKEHI